MLQSFDSRALARGGIAVIFGVTIAVVGASAEAGFVPPDLTMTVDVSDGVDDPLFSDIYIISATAPNAMGFYTYALPDLGQADYGFSMGLISGRTQTDGDAFPNFGTQLVPDFTVNNDTGDDLIFRISMIMPVQLAPGADWTSVSGWSVAGPAGQSEVLSFGGESMWRALIDSSVVGTLYDAPDGTNGSLTADPVVGSFGPINDSIQIDLTFLVTGADDGIDPQTVLIGVNGNLVLTKIPAPGSLALVTVGAAITRRRRRR